MLSMNIFYNLGTCSAMFGLVFTECLSYTYMVDYNKCSLFKAAKGWSGENMGSAHIEEIDGLLLPPGKLIRYRLVI